MIDNVKPLYREVDYEFLLARRGASLLEDTIGKGGGPKSLEFIAKEP